MTGRTRIDGTNNQTPGVMSAPSTLLTDTTTTVGLTLKQNASAPGGQVMFRMIDTDGTTTFVEITNGLDFVGYGMHIGAAGSTSSATMRLDGTQTIPCLRFPDGTGTGARWYSGTGAPSSTTVGAGAVGDLYFRRDFPAFTGGSRTSNVVTLTGMSSHGIVTGDKIIVSAADTSYNGTFTVTSTTSTTVVYSQTAADDASSGAGTAHPSLYICTVAGSPGTWSGIA